MLQALIRALSLPQQTPLLTVSVKAVRQRKDSTKATYMKYMKCPKGHIYDQGIYGDSCPLCEKDCQDDIPQNDIPGLIRMDISHSQLYSSPQTIKSEALNSSHKASQSCPKCGFPCESGGINAICPYCGSIFSAGYEKQEVTDANGNTTAVIRFQSEKRF